MREAALYLGVALLVYALVTGVQRKSVYLSLASAIAGLLVTGGAILVAREQNQQMAQSSSQALSLIGPATCEALDAMQLDEHEQARAIFTDRVHGPLHDLARKLQRADAAAAGELLVAKNAVEESTSIEAGTAELEATLRKLAQALDRGLRRLGMASPPCLRNESS